MHGQYDTDIFNVTGVKKRDGEKSYDYAKRVLGEYKTKADSVKTVQAELDAANVKVTELQTKLEKNAGNEELTQQLKDAKAQVTQLQSKLKTEQDNYKTKEAEFNKQLKDVHVDYVFKLLLQVLSSKLVLLSLFRKHCLMQQKLKFWQRVHPIL